MGNKYRKACKLLERYYGQILESLADEVIAHEEDLDDPIVGKGDEIADRYASRLAQSSVCL